MIRTTKLLAALDLIANKLNISPEDVRLWLIREGVSAWWLYRDLGRMGYHWTGEVWLHMHPMPEWYQRLKKFSSRKS